MSDEKMHTKMKERYTCIKFSVFVFFFKECPVGEKKKNAQWMCLEWEEGLGHSYKEYLHLGYWHKEYIKGVKRKFIQKVITAIKKGEPFKKGSERHRDFFNLFSSGLWLGKSSY